MKKTFTTIFFIQSFWWLLSSCHKEVTGPVTIPVQQPPVKEIVNNDLQWSLNSSTSIASATLASLQGRPSANSADSILAVYILGGTYVAIRKGNPQNYTEFYYQVEKNSIILHKKYPKSNLPYENIGILIQMVYLPKKAKVVFR